MLQLFKQYWQNNFLQISNTNSHIIVAVSGGIDSVVLTHLLQQSNISFSIAHCNFGLRGQESERDEQFVQQLAHAYNVPFYVQKFNTENFAQSNKLSIQVAARTLRYNWFFELVQQTKTSSNNVYIATAHNANDNVETVLMNFCRGTGIGGLHGIVQQNHIIRPLLFAQRNAIEAYAAMHNILWVQDSSNNTDKYTRNYFRHQIIPLIQKVFPAATENILSNIERWKEVEQVYNNSINAIKKNLLQYKGNDVYIPILKLQKQQPLNTIIFEIIKQYGFSAQQIEEVIKLLNAENSKYITSATHRIIKNRNWLIIATKTSTIANTIIIEASDKVIAFTNTNELNIQSIPASNYAIKNNQQLAAIDASKITYPLILRKWKEGDYFYPLGMKKKKKLARFFIDNKLSATVKEKIFVLESNKKIVWVIGYRIDDRFKLLPSTQQVLQLEIKTRMSNLV